MCKTLPLLVLLLSLGAFAQTTTTYTVSAPTSGVNTTPFRAFSIPLDPSAEINWLEVGVNTSCDGQTASRLGFIFLTMDGAAFPCASLVDDPVTGGSPSSTGGNFAGVDNNGVHFTGTYSFVITTTYRCSGGRGGGGCHSVFTIKSGSVTVTR